MIRPRFINELKTISQIRKVQFQIISPEGINKLPSSYFIVELVKHDNSMQSTTGLFEYAYGAIRLVALDNEELAKKGGDDIITFFESPLQQSTSASVFVYEVKSSK